MDSVLEISTLNIDNLNGLIALLEKHSYRKASYYQLGIHLLLSDNTLKSIEQEHRGQVDRCFTECLASWLRKVDAAVQTPTIDALIAALRGIKENAVADGINEDRRKIHSLPSIEIINQDRPTATPTSEVNENRPDQPVILEIDNKVKGHPELHLIAYSLQQKYYDLVVAVRQSLINYEIDTEGIKLLIKVYLIGETRDDPVMKKYIDVLQKISDFNSLFDYLIDNHFIGYLNYNLLKRISKCVSDDVSLMNQIDDYEKKYAALLNHMQISCKDVVRLFEERPDLSPTAPIGLPHISFRLDSPWLLSRFYNWVLTFVGEFSWSYDAFLAQLRENCIIVTYVILPSILDEVIRDLKDSVILKKLENKGITVIELPQDENNFEASEEDPQAESVLNSTYNNIQLVLACKKWLTDNLDLEKFVGFIGHVEFIGHVGKFIKIAYNRVNAAGPRFTDLQIKVQSLGYGIIRLCNNSFITINSFRETAETVSSRLQSIYQFLLDSFDDAALISITSLGDMAKKMAELASELKEKFSESFDDALDKEKIASDEGVKRYSDKAREKAKIEDQERPKIACLMKNDGDMAEVAIRQSLHEAAVALRQLAAIMMEAEIFWKNIQYYCESMSDDFLAELIEDAKGMNVEGKKAYWKSQAFIREVMCYHARWIALHDGLHDVCKTYQKQIDLTRAA